MYTLCGSPPRFSLHSLGVRTRLLRPSVLEQLGRASLGVSLRSQVPVLDLNPRNLNCRGIFVCGRIRTKKSGARLLTNLVAVQKTHISILHIHRHTGVPAHGHAPKPILNACFFQRPKQVSSKYESKSFTKHFENHRNEFSEKN